MGYNVRHSKVIAARISQDQKIAILADESDIHSRITAIETVVSCDIIESLVNFVFDSGNTMIVSQGHPLRLVKEVTDDSGKVVFVQEGI